MSEILSGAQIPKGVSEPQYWNGHSYDDECAWVESPIKNHRELYAHYKKIGQEQKKIIDASRPFIDDFWDKGSNVVLSEFRSGTTFNAAEDLHSLLKV
jgi:hypothetical protein